MKIGAGWYISNSHEGTITSSLNCLERIRKENDHAKSISNLLCGGDRSLGGNLVCANCCASLGLPSLPTLRLHVLSTLRLLSTVHIHVRLPALLPALRLYLCVPAVLLQAVCVLIRLPSVSCLRLCRLWSAHLGGMGTPLVVAGEAF
jgi:hypothetical protein